MQKMSTLIVHKSPYSQEQTIDKLKKIFQEKGVKIFTIINHSGEAHQVSLQLDDLQVLVFGDPKTGTYLMQENPEIGIELPLKILVWQSPEKQTCVGYKDPILLADMYGIKKNIEILKKMHNGLAGLVEKVIS